MSPRFAGTAAAADSDAVLIFIVLASCVVARSEGQERWQLLIEWPV
jgi:hypothetical protein